MVIKKLNHKKLAQKIHASRGRLKKFMQVKVDEIYMRTMYCGCGLFSFGDFAPFYFCSTFPKTYLKSCHHSFKWP